MTEHQTSDPDVNRVIRSWLHEDRHEDVSRIAGAVLDQVGAIPRRRARWWPAWRTPNMNRIVAFGMAAAAAVAIVVIGAQLLRSPTNNPGTQPTATPSPTPHPTPERLLPARHWHNLWQGGPDGVTINILTPAPDWYGEPGGGILSKNQNIDAPDGAGLIVFAQTNDLLQGVGDVYVYDDPCHWKRSRPRKPVTTVDEAITALANQASRQASPPHEVTVGGYPGKSITLHVPDGAVFDDCDQGEFRTLVEGTDAARYAQAPGQIDELWVVDVSGELAIIDAAYYVGTPPSVVDELRAIVASAALSYVP